MDTLLGLFMLAGQVFAIGRAFGGFSTSPKWLNIVGGIGAILFGFAFIVMIGEQL